MTDAAPCPDPRPDSRPGSRPGSRNELAGAERPAASARRRDSDGDAGPTAPVDGPERRCIATRAVRPKSALVRFVIGPDDTVVPDVEGKLPGRGLWVSADRAALDQAVAKNAFARAARRRVRVPADLVDRVEALLERRLVQLLSLARGAGAAVAGFVKVEERLRASRKADAGGAGGRPGRVALVFAARDGADDGRRKIAGLAAGAGAPVVEVLDAGALGRAFGRDAVVHAAVAAGGLAERLAVEAARLDGIRRAGDDAPASKG